MEFWEGIEKQPQRHEGQSTYVHTYIYGIDRQISLISIVTPDSVLLTRQLLHTLINVY